MPWDEEGGNKFLDGQGLNAKNRRGWAAVSVGRVFLAMVVTGAIEECLCYYKSAKCFPK